MVYEMFSKGFIVVVVVAFIAFIILMEVSGLAQSHLVLLTCSFLIKAQNPKRSRDARTWLHANVATPSRGQVKRTQSCRDDSQ